MNQNANKRKLKKDIKWYTYVDDHLNSKLKAFMGEYKISNQAKLLRTSVNTYIDLVNAIYEKKSIKEIKEYEQERLSDFMKKAIECYEISDDFQEELRQKISPLKVAVLLLQKLMEEPERFSEVFNNAKNALEELENVVKQRYDEPELVRFVKKIDILYVEDNELERKTVDTYFKRNGINIKSVATAEEAIYLLKKLTPKAVLLDISLKTSKINGDQLCKMLKSNGEYGRIPIILISAVINEQEKDELLRDTMAEGIIMKPIEELRDLDILFKYLKQF